MGRNPALPLVVVRNQTGQIQPKSEPDLCGFNLCRAPYCLKTGLDVFMLMEGGDQVLPRISGVKALQVVYQCRGIRLFFFVCMK